MTDEKQCVETDMSQRFFEVAKQINNACQNLMSVADFMHNMGMKELAKRHREQIKELKQVGRAFAVEAEIASVTAAEPTGDDALDARIARYDEEIDALTRKIDDPKQKPSERAHASKKRNALRGHRSRLLQYVTKEKKEGDAPWKHSLSSRSLNQE